LKATEFAKRCWQSARSKIFLWPDIGLHQQRLEMNCIELLARHVLPRF